MSEHQFNKVMNNQFQFKNINKLKSKLPASKKESYSLIREFEYEDGYKDPDLESKTWKNKTKEIKLEKDALRPIDRVGYHPLPMGTFPILKTNFKSMKEEELNKNGIKIETIKKSENKLETNRALYTILGIGLTVYLYTFTDYEIFSMLSGATTLLIAFKFL